MDRPPARDQPGRAAGDDDLAGPVPLKLAVGADRAPAPTPPVARAPVMAVESRAAELVVEHESARRDEGPTVAAAGPPRRPVGPPRGTRERDDARGRKPDRDQREDRERPRRRAGAPHPTGLAAAAPRTRSTSGCPPARRTARHAARRTGRRPTRPDRAARISAKRSVVVSRATIARVMANRSSAADAIPSPTV